MAWASGSSHFYSQNHLDGVGASKVLSLFLREREKKNIYSFSFLPFFLFCSFLFFFVTGLYFLWVKLITYFSLRKNLLFWLYDFLWPYSHLFSSLMIKLLEFSVYIVYIFFAPSCLCILVCDFFPCQRNYFLSNCQWPGFNMQWTHLILSLL